MYKKFIFCGCLLWIISFFSEISNLQPFSTIGIFFSILLLVIGILLWLRFYKSSRGHYPKFNSIYDQERYRTKFDFITSHLLEFWTFCILFWIFGCALGTVLLITSEPFALSKDYCNHNTEILNKTGKIKYYGILVQGVISSKNGTGNAEVSFTIVGTKGNFPVRINLLEEKSTWKINNVYMR